MKYSRLFGKTIKESPREAGNISTKLLIQGGFIRESVAGRYYFLPLGMRVHDKIMQIIEKEMDAAGAQKMITPTLHPLELWQETNRTSSAGFELMKVKDRRGAEFALGGTAEEMIVDLVRKFNLSYRDLPFTIYQFSQKFRDELRARGGLLRVREFMMKDAYSFHRDEVDFKKEYENMWQTYLRIFKQLGLNALVAESDNGYIGGEYCHEFIVESEVGESRVFATEDGSYVAHEDVAVSCHDIMNPDESIKEMEIKEAPRGPTIQDGVDLYKQPAWRQIKSVLYKTDQGKFVLVALRGDLEINEVKLCHVLGCLSLEGATEDEIRSLGSEPGFISPLKLKIKKVGDFSLKTVRNFYTGADIFQKDALNVNYGRDFTVDKEADIALVKLGQKTKDGKIFVEKLGIEVGNIFQLGKHYSSRMHATFTQEGGKETFYYMGCYGIGVGRTLATIVEKYHDERGIIWPKVIAPFMVHLITLSGKTSEIQANIQANAQVVYEQMQAEQIDILWDDRHEVSAGEKFADADLIGIPLRLVISERTLQDHAIEWKERSQKETHMIPVADLKESLHLFISHL
ncbi:proline--tRNA ligase [Candidatus Uhrbacteria bacterium CG_4_9_14_3_um_filter_36_7]|uniref:Proline--tRNA ligase n=1 Tax=Candidatus Uhrbacteria bacterium CG_4_9_14_3_um_filter_36_7 TaxID=1975033 RepID=A0A2M7XHH5_9BACT|nr:MAG: proline--tRNA ligase [Candidatus Uhrbacteria bacterium CG_4_9_14_3_um_filter_36_7]